MVLVSFLMGVATCHHTFRVDSRRQQCNQITESLKQEKEKRGKNLQNPRSFLNNGDLHQSLIL